MFDTTEGRRSIPHGLSPLLAELELERPNPLTLAELSITMRRLGINGTPAKVVEKLRRLGWLLTTGIAGVYEFAPAERGGPISEGDALLTLRAAVARTPQLRIAAALGTALYLLNIADRGPDKPEVAVPKRQRVAHLPPAIFRSYRVLRFDWKLPPQIIQGAPVHRPATVLVHLADRPTQVRSWAAMLQLLPAILAASPLSEIITEIDGRSKAAKIRLAYLTYSLDPAIAEAVNAKRSGKVWFGPRGPLRRHSSRWNVADTLLPFAPADLARDYSAGSKRTNAA